jgi:integrase/recombinase XerD
MSTNYFSDPVWLRLLRRAPAAAYLDGFIAALVEAGYRPLTIQSHLLAAAHMSCWLRQRGRSLTDLDEGCVEEFNQHLPACQCAGYERTSKRVAHGARLFLAHLRKIAIVTTLAPRTAPMPPLLAGFFRWMTQHRGAKVATLNAYRRIILDALETLGEDPRHYDAARLRAFILDRARRHGRSKAKLVTCALRSFLRYLITQGQSQVGLDEAIPTVAGWRLAALPRYLRAADVERVLAACDPNTKNGARDRALLLLIARLGLRAGDVCRLRLGDIDWVQSTVQVLGKSHRATQLPLPQEVGDAILHYLMTASATQSDRVFLRVTPPVGLPLTRTGISCIVKRAIIRAGVSAPTHGAHVLRNSAATSLLADGASLESIAVVLRHRSLDTTTLYAKVDFKMLQELARAWPEVSPC